MSEPRSKAVGAVREVAGAALATLPILVLFVGVLPVVLIAAEGLKLTGPETAALIIAVYGVPGVITLIFGLRYKQPILFTANLSIIVFVASLAGTMPVADIAGGTAIAGIAYALLALARLPHRLAALVPTPVIMGILAGISLPFVTGVFDELARAPVLVGATVGAFVVARGLRLSSGGAVLVAFATGLAVAAVRGDLGAGPASVALAGPVATLPHLTLAGAMTVVPMVLVFVALANVPSVVYLRDRGFRPPRSAVDLASGVGTTVASFFGPAAVCVPFMLAPLTAGDTVGPKRTRIVTAMIAGAYLLVIAAFAGAATAAVALIPRSLVTCLAGLALLDVLVGALQSIGRSRLRLGPAVAFATTLSQLAWFGLAPLFWAVALGAVTAHLVERHTLVSS